MSLSRPRHVVVVSSLCRRHFVAMPWPCRRHVVAMSSCWCGCFVAFNLRVLTNRGPTRP
jgi:hypothetical protein